MSILATTTRLVSGAASLFATNVEKNQAGERCFSFAQDLLRICQNKLDIRYLLALYREVSQTLELIIRSRTVHRRSTGVRW